ncbi:Alkaline phosphatase synthesis sensor protein PhoR [Kordia antarctica]|uniref:histidine kinase n=1 Tax=Kordia antarctica TaxID=1218801 RepID=A0A7L4ZPB4_9FLAO|nr:HAMP domain-containing sensor histidine kinase [Kordia antarctica]QHI38320.1 Alkaline phosphatase synthesis sensor protein PhoR [Kordia antarctica]
MKQQRSSWVLYTIIATIAITIAVQVYWNYKNYQVNKQQFINQVQISLDNAVEAYYVAIAKNDRMMFITMDTSTNTDDIESIKRLKNASFDSIFLKIEHRMKTDSNTVIIENSQPRFPSNIQNDSLLTATHSYKKYAVPQLLRKKDSIRMLQEISSLYISITEDSLDFKKLKTFLDIEFDRKQIAVPYHLKQYVNSAVVNEISNTKLPSRFLKTNAKSAYLKPGETLELHYANISKTVWKRSLFGILLSTLLSLAIISSLVYLLRVIRQQKQLAEIKNDLISNITHEFKTPITTISTALEAIQHFDALKDPEKAQKYLDISDKQLKKLHLMVEKLLETATLDSENLMLKKETIDIVNFTQNITEKQQALTTEKTIEFRSNIESQLLDLDPFHFENAITNLIDNALKYGGSEIKVNVKKTVKSIEITVADNGDSIDKSQREKIFDKFYRIPKGNTHDVKGFGIGLYYTKKIIEKHNGTIQLVSDTTLTIFKITLLG